jgi:hypothetical protein
VENPGTERMQGGPPTPLDSDDPNYELEDAMNGKGVAALREALQEAKPETKMDKHLPPADCG